jgi:hypothetical protein
MGLDIAFNREAANRAGIETDYLRNSTDDDIIDALIERLVNGAFMYGDDHFKWLTEMRQCVKVPGTEYWLNADGVDDYIVRANKWGVAYEPLTNWLRANNIEWTEC